MNAEEQRKSLARAIMYDGEIIARVAKELTNSNLYDDDELAKKMIALELHMEDLKEDIDAFFHFVKKNDADCAKYRPLSNVNNSKKKIVMSTLYGKFKK